MAVAAAPSCVLLLLLFLVFLLSCDTGPTETIPPDMIPFLFSKQNLKHVITLLERQIKVLHQRQLTLKHVLLKKQNKSKTHLKELKGSFVKEIATPTSLTPKGTTFFNSYSKLVGTKLHKMTSNILMDAAGEHNEVKSAGIKEDIKERTLLSDLKQDKRADNNDDRSIRTTSIMLPVALQSTYSLSKSQIENYSLKHSKGISEVSEVSVASNITSQHLKMESVKLKDGAMQMIINSSVSKKVKHVLEKGKRKPLLKPDHDMMGKSTTPDSKINHPITVLEPLKIVFMGKPTHQPPSFEKSNPTVTSDPKDRSQSIMRQQAELTLKVLEKVLCYLKRENEMQTSLSPYEKIQASIMANILQFNEQKGPGKTDSSKDKLKIKLKQESTTVLVSNSNHSLIEAQATTVPNISTNVTSKSEKHANRLEKYEGAQDKEKVAEVKEMLKDITIACIAITALILAMIAFLLICISLFLKKTQEAVTTSQNKETQLQGDYTGNQNNNNLIFVDEESTDNEFVSENEDSIEHLKTQLVENMSCNSPSREPDILLSTEHLQELHDYYSPSCNCSHENHSEHSKTFKTNPTSCNHPEHFEKSEDHEDKRFQEKYTAPYRKDSDHQRPSIHKSELPEARSICSTCSTKHCRYCSSSRVTHFSSNASVTLGVNETINDSRLFQHDGSQCACFKFLRGSTDSYSD